MNKKTNTLALISMIIGILSIFLDFCCGIGILFAIVSITLGFISRYQIKKSIDKEKGMGFALTGIITGFFAIIIVIVLFIIGFFSNSDIKEFSAKNNTNPKSTSKSVENKTKDTNPKSTLEPIEKEKANKEGETIDVGYTSYAIWRSWWSTKLSNNEFLDQKPDAMFLFIEISVRNNDKKARMIPPFTLVDENNYEYEASPNSWIVENSIGIINTLNPGVNKQGLIVFDVPPNNKYKLKVSGGYWSVDDALIEINPKEE